MLPTVGGELLGCWSPAGMGRALFGVAVPKFILLAGGCMRVFSPGSEEGSEVSPLLPAAAGRLPVIPPSSPQRSAGIAAIPHDPGSPERSGKEEGSAPAKERADVIWGGGNRALLLSPNFYCRAGGPVRKCSEK